MADDEGPERTEDGHWILVDGRRWRATDPAIPESFRQQLVDELMDARRAVAQARRAGDDAAVAAARERVGWAKLALGERGEPWWDAPTLDGQRDRLASAILALSTHRSPDRTICPSDAARAIGGERWRDLLPLARDIARDLARSGAVEVTQRGAVLDPDDEWRGPVRIRSA